MATGPPVGHGPSSRSTEASAGFGSPRAEYRSVMGHPVCDSHAPFAVPEGPRLLAESGDNLTSAVDAEPRPQDWQVEAGIAVLRDALATARRWADQANGIKQAVA